MATPYFDVTVPAHLLLLPEAIRAASELPEVAEQAEADVLGAHSGTYCYEDAVELSDDSGVYVYLRGYAEDAADAPARLVAALRAEIADVIRWRLARSRRDPNVDSESAGERSTTYREDAEHAFPPDFGRRLRPFLVRPRGSYVL